MNKEELQERFSALDQEDSGFISLDNFRRILHEYAKEYNVILRIQNIETNRDVLISFQEFQDYMLRNVSDTPPVYYHPNGSINWVSTFQFENPSSTLPREVEISDIDLDVSEEMVLELLQQLDNENGQISFAEFLKYHKPDKDAFQTINLKI